MDAVTKVQRQQLVETVMGWGQALAERAYGPQGPGLDVDLAAMEDVAVEMQRALLKGFCEKATRQQAARLPAHQPCPTCSAECHPAPPARIEASGPPGEAGRPIQTRGGPFQLQEPQYYCPACRRAFFPSALGAARGQSRLHSGRVGQDCD